MMTLPQGSPLSPACFNAYTLPITRVSLPAKFEILTFADGVLAVGAGKDMATQDRQMQSVLDDIRAV